MSPAAAAEALPSSVPDNAAVANGSVGAIARAGGLTYIGGSFTELQVNQAGFASVNATTGANAGLPPVAGGLAQLGDVVADGSAAALAVDGGRLYAGGSFSTVRGAARPDFALFAP